MRVLFSSIAATAFLIAGTLPGHAAGKVVPASSQPAAGQTYRFEMADAPESAGEGKHVISVRLIRAADNKPVAGAVIIQTRLDMSPENMSSMTAPLKPVLARVSGIYSFVTDDSKFWKWKGKWALSLTAKVQGEPRPVTGSVVFQAGQ